MDARRSDIYRIVGGRRLSGTVAAAGSKNASLPIMAAALLASEPVVLRRAPRVGDVRTMAALLRRHGMHVARREESLEISAAGPPACVAPAEFVGRMRASFCVLGPLVARYGRAVVPLPGGCAIGPRPVDIHLRGLAALGATIACDEGVVYARARRLRGAEIDLSGPRGPSVTGTANILTAAVLAHGTSVLHRAATEPEIVDLGHFLRKLGARIEGLGTPTIVVQGVDQLGGCEHEVIADRIEAATLLTAAAVTAGDVCVERVEPDHLHAVLETLATAGAGVECGPRNVRIVAAGPLRSCEFSARPYPGIPTDAQAQLTVVAALADGESTIRDDVFPLRFGHVGPLRRFGVDASQGPGAVRVRGVERLQAARVTASDLRASAALVLAGLAAQGTTCVARIDHLDRGYENLAGKIRSLGAEITRLRPRAVPRPRVAAVSQGV